MKVVLEESRIFEMIVKEHAAPGDKYEVRLIVCCREIEKQLNGETIVFAEPIQLLEAKKD